jgi:hypothetical protein
MFFCKLDNRLWRRPLYLFPVHNIREQYPFQFFTSLGCYARYKKAVHLTLILKVQLNLKRRQKSNNLNGAFSLKTKTFTLDLWYNPPSFIWILLWNHWHTYVHKQTHTQIYIYICIYIYIYPPPPHPKDSNMASYRMDAFGIRIEWTELSQNS